MYFIPNVLIDLTAITIVLLIFFAGKHNENPGFSQSIFDKMSICMLFYLVIDIIAWIADGKSFSGSFVIQVALNSGIYLTQLLFTFFWFLYTLFWIKQSSCLFKKNALLCVVPLIIQIGLLVLNIFTGWIFKINEYHFYERGQYFIQCGVVFYFYNAASLCLIIKEFITKKNKKRRYECLIMSGFMILPTVASLILLLFIYGLSLSAPFYALSLLMIYLSVHMKLFNEEKLKVITKDAEIEKAKVAIMLSQIQPHFLYNSLSVIQALCEIKPEAASYAVNEFTDYLRGNMDSLTMTTPIPFEQELTHTKHYLTLEKLRFGSKIDIEYDINTIDFTLPTLTLQPIVENAVRYGITKKEDGGKIIISTKETEQEYVITVSDNGVGYDFTHIKNDGRTHIGIKNVRERLKKMSGGSLDISSTVGVGTVAVITIPKVQE